MSLATRCTACGTVFRVVQDQLKVSEGWVRCGRCQAVFNALEALFDLEREAPPPRVTRAPAEAAAPAAPAHGEFVASHLPATPDEEPLPATQEEDAIESRFFALSEADAGAPRAAPDRPDFVDARFPSELPADDEDDEDDEDWAAPPPDAPVVPVEPAAPPAPRPLFARWRARRAARRAAAAAARQPAESAHADTRLESRHASDDDHSVLDTEALLGDESMLMAELPPAAAAIDEHAEMAALAELMAPPAAAAPDAPTPGFLRQADRAARWQRPRVRASLAVAALLLVGLLTGQIAIQFRDAFAARWPESRPVLEALCETMGCTLGPLRRVAALGVEASGLAPGDAPELYRLTLTLRNRDSVALATPSVDLSLTDLRGELITRKVLAPQELLRQPGRVPLGAALEAASETPVEVHFTVRDARVSGYTVELFYP